MKNSINLVAYLLLLVGSMGFYACGNGPTKQIDKTSKEYASAYICPMHCEGSGSATAGKCPVCKMDYVANPDVKQQLPVNKNGHEGHDHGDAGHEGHDHGDGGHEGHDHDDHSGHNH